MKEKCNVQSRGFTLPEILLASVIFTIIALGAGSLFIQNQRLAYSERARTLITNTALNLLEQIRVKPEDVKTGSSFTASDSAYNTIYRLYNSLATDSTCTLRVVVADPNYAHPTPDPAPDLTALPLPGYRPYFIKVNVRDGTVNDATWTNIDLPIESALTAPKMPARFWLTIKRIESTTTPVVRAFEIVLMYQWKTPGQVNTGNNDWNSGTVRLLIGEKNPYDPDANTP